MFQWLTHPHYLEAQGWWQLWSLFTLDSKATWSLLPPYPRGNRKRGTKRYNQVLAFPQPRSGLQSFHFIFHHPVVTWSHLTHYKGGWEMHSYIQEEELGLVKRWQSLPRWKRTHTCEIANLVSETGTQGRITPILSSSNLWRGSIPKGFMNVFCFVLTMVVRDSIKESWGLGI